MLAECWVSLFERVNSLEQLDELFKILRPVNDKPCVWLVYKAMLLQDAGKVQAGHLYVPFF